MTNNIYISTAFKREVKPLAKKYKTLKISVDLLIDALSQDPFLGDAYGHDIFKVRLADESKGKGKRGGFRVMYYHLRKTASGIDILLLSIYDKSEKSTIKKSEAVKILGDILHEYDKNKTP